MTSELATVLAGAIAGVCGLAGLWSGVAVSRRQIRDQAAVEHGQWLRSQRQDAYIALLDAWDSAVAALQLVVNEEDVEVHRQVARRLREQGDDRAHLEQNERSVDGQVQQALSEVSRPLERVSLLGPAHVDGACGNLYQTLEALGASVRSRSDSEDWPDYGLYEAASERASAARARFVIAARASVRAAPRPGR